MLKSSYPFSSLHSRRENDFSFFLGGSPIDSPSYMPSIFSCNCNFFLSVSSFQPTNWTFFLTWHHSRVPLLLHTPLLSLTFELCLCHCSVSLLGHHVYFSMFSFLIPQQHFKNSTTSPARVSLETSPLPQSKPTCLTTVMAHVSMLSELLQYLMNLGCIHIA